MSRSEQGTAADGDDPFYTPQPTASNADNISRVIVKNLPKYITPEQVRKHFSVRGYTITDLKFAKTQYISQKLLYSHLNTHTFLLLFPFVETEDLEDLLLSGFLTERKRKTAKHILIILSWTRADYK